MTRINLIPPCELTTLHLIAEYRELPRVFGLVRKHQAYGRYPRDLNIPKTYRMGSGHVTFFFNKLTFLVKRQQSIIDEMRARGIKARFDDPTQLVMGLDPEWRNDWVPSPRELSVSRRRIRERLGQ